MAMVPSYGGRRVQRARKPDVQLDPELVGELRDTSVAMIVWPVA